MAPPNPPDQGATASPPQGDQPFDLSQYDTSTPEAIEATYNSISTNLYAPLLAKIAANPIGADYDGSRQLLAAYNSALTQLKTRQSGLYQQEARANNAKDPALVQSQIAQNQAQVKEIEARTKEAQYKLDHPSVDLNADPQYVQLKKDEIAASIASNTAQTEHVRFQEQQQGVTNALEGQRVALEGQRVALESQRTQYEGQRVANETAKLPGEITQQGANTAYTQAQTAAVNQKTAQDAQGDLATKMQQWHAMIASGDLTQARANDLLSAALGYGTPAQRDQAQFDRTQGLVSQAATAHTLVPSGYTSVDPTGAISAALKKVGIQYTAPQNQVLSIPDYAKAVGMNLQPPQMAQAGGPSPMAQGVAQPPPGTIMSAAQLQASPYLAGQRVIGGPLDLSGGGPAVTAPVPVAPGGAPAPVGGAPINPTPRF